MKTSESIKNIAGAVLNFHKEVGKIPKTEKNPFFKSSYASLPVILDAISEPLLKAGLTFMQFPKGQNELETIIMHPESGEWMSETYYMKPVKEDPQAFGSVITYQRRYALGAILGLNIDEDDDANKATIQKESKPLKDTPPPPIQLTPDSEKWADAIGFIQRGGKIADIKKKYVISDENAENLLFSAEISK
jgi:hypothetical protein